MAGLDWTKQDGKFYYGWWIVLGGFLIMGTCYTSIVNCIPIFQSHVVADLGITVGAFNTGTSLCTVVAIFASLVFGKLIDKTSSRVLGAFTVIVTSVCLICFSFVTSLWQFYLICIIAGMIVVAGTRLLVSVLIANWFTLRRGLAVSIALAGSGAGGVILSPVTSSIIASQGWRQGFVTLGIICLIAALPLVVIVFRNHPSDKGLLPYGYGQAEAAEKSKSPDVPVTIAVGWSACRKSAGFWLLVIGFVMMGIDNGAIITNSVSNMTIVGGHDTIWAGNVWALYLGVVIVAKISLGAIYDHFGMKTGTIFGSIASFIAAIALCFPATTWGPVLAAVTFGFATCMGTVAPPIMVVKEYGQKDLGTVTGIVTAFEMLGAATGSIVSGILFDKAGTFMPAWIMVIIATAVMLVTLGASIPAARKLVQKCKDAGAPELDAEGKEIDEEPAMDQAAEGEVEMAEAATEAGAAK